MELFNILASTDTCNNFFTPEAIKLLNELLGYFRILAPAVLIIMVAIDLIGIMMSNERDMRFHVKFVQRIVLRTIACILIFFVPTIISILLNLDAVKESLNVDPLCLQATGTEAPTDVFEMFGVSPDMKPAGEGHEPQNNGSSTGGSGTASSSGHNGSSSGSGETSITDGDPDKRARKTVTIKGRTYDSYLQGDFADVPFSHENIKTAGCSCIAFTQAASGFNRDLTVFKAATMFEDRTFDGIASALRQEGIPYSSVIYYNSNDYENTKNGKARAQAVVEQVRAHLDQGKPAIAIIQGAPYAGGLPHFITLFGEDEEGHLITGNSRKEVGSLEELVQYSLQGGRKGFMLVG